MILAMFFLAQLSQYNNSTYLDILRAGGGESGLVTVIRSNLLNDLILVGD